MATINNESGNKKKRSPLRYALIGLGIGALGAAGYFSWRYFSAKKVSGSDKPSPDPDPLPLPEPRSDYKPMPRPVPSKRTDDFPLKRGSRGGRVKVLQEALIAKHGKSILPKYAADSDFGKETEDALKKLKLPTSIDESTFFVITRQNTINPTDLAREIFQALFNRSFDKTMQGLRKIRNKDEYKQVSQSFQYYRLGLVRQTLVNAALGAFSKEDQKQQLRLEFLRMGLRYDGNKWSLEGLNGLQLITIQTARIWKTQHTYVTVPKQTVLGTEIGRKGRYSLFENGGKYFMVNTTQVQYL